MTTLTPEPQELVDRQKIYHVPTSYCRALDRCDVELMKSVYREDGYDDHGVFAVNAQEFAGFIFDRLEKRGGLWRIAKRTVIMDWNLNQPSSDIRTEGMFRTLRITGRRDRQDPIYQR